MGTRFEIVLPGDEPPRLRAAAEVAAEAIEETHRQFTRFERSSLLAHLERSAPGRVVLSREDAEIFAAAETIRIASAGGFDPGLGRRSDGGFRLDRRGGTVALLDPDVRLDFGAIAKGFAVDRAVARLIEAGVTAGFVHGGTSSARGFGIPPGQPGWRVAVADGGPDVALRDEALSVASTASGGDGPGRWHVTDPRNGRILDFRRRAVAMGPGAGWADGWSTAVLVTGQRPAAMGPEWTVWLEEEGTWRTIDPIR